MARQTNHQLPTVITKPLTTNGYGRGNNEPRTAITWTISSTMHVPVFWRNSLGVTAIESQRVLGTEKEALTITIEYYFNQNAAIDARELLRDLEDNDYSDLRKDVAAQVDRINHDVASINSHRRFQYTVGISYEDLYDLGGSIYLQDVDLVVGFKSAMGQGSDIHPYSTIGKLDAVNKSLILERGTQQRILIVDNSGIEKTYYVNTGQAVLACRTIRDPSLLEGFYVTTRDASDRPPHTICYSYEEATKQLGIYTNRKDAEDMGSPEDRYKASVKELEREINIEKQESARLKAEQETQKALYDAKKSEYEERRLETERQLKEAERQREHDNKMRDYEMKRLNSEIEHAERREKAYLDELERTHKQKDIHRTEESKELEYERKRIDAERKQRQEMWKGIVDVGKSLLAVFGVVVGFMTVYQKNFAPKG